MAAPLLDAKSLPTISDMMAGEERKAKKVKRTEKEATLIRDAWK